MKRSGLCMIGDGSRIPLMLSMLKSARRRTQIPSGIPHQFSYPRVVAAAVLLLGCAVSLTLSWPGQLSYDSVVQLHDGHTGHYNPWHPPVMAWMLGLFDAFVPGTGLFVIFDEILFFASFASLLWLARRPSWIPVPVAALCV